MIFGRNIIFVILNFVYRSNLEALCNVCLHVMWPTVETAVFSSHCIKLILRAFNVLEQDSDLGCSTATGDAQASEFLKAWMNGLFCLR